MYFVIRNSDGDTRVESINQKELEERLNEQYYGSDVVFLDSIPENTDTNYWGDAVLIIKGEIATPKPVETVTSYSI